MKYLQIIFLFVLVYGTTSCSSNTPEEKGFQVQETAAEPGDSLLNSLNKDSLKFETRPSNVLLTGINEVRLTTIYKVNTSKRNNTRFIGSNEFHYRYEDSEISDSNNWNNNLMPGIEAVYGYNMVNVSLYNIRENEQKLFFEKPVLIKTLYYPSFSRDTLNGKQVTRDFCMVSVYNEDTNKDGFINLKDLRRLFLFNVKGEKQKALVPENYSVLKSEYDSANDLMYVFAQSDSKQNGRPDEGEPVHVFWIDLKDPNKTGRLY